MTEIWIDAVASTPLVLPNTPTLSRSTSPL